MEIYQKAFDIIERYFGTEEEDKDVSEPSSAQLRKYLLIILFPLFTDRSCRGLQSVHLWVRR